MKSFFLFLIRVYKNTLSPYIGSCCRFSPSCSDYAADCIKNLPLYKALPLVAWRLIRCGPWSKGGYDPAPKR